MRWLRFIGGVLVAALVALMFAPTERIVLVEKVMEGTVTDAFALLSDPRAVGRLQPLIVAVDVHHFANNHSYSHHIITEALPVPLLHRWFGWTINNSVWVQTSVEHSGDEYHARSIALRQARVMNSLSGLGLSRLLFRASQSFTLVPLLSESGTPHVAVIDEFHLHTPWLLAAYSAQTAESAHRAILAALETALRQQRQALLA